MNFKNYLFYFIWALLVGFSTNIHAEMSSIDETVPPIANPHSPVSELEKKSVALAEVVLKSILSQPLPTLQTSDAGNLTKYSDKNLTCLQDKTCWMNDASFVSLVKAISEKNGRAVEWKHLHVIPWSLGQDKVEPVSADSSPRARRADSKIQVPSPKPDEFMVHAYVSFEKSSDWYHLNFFMTKNSQGEPTLRYLFNVSMKDVSQFDMKNVRCQLFIGDKIYFIQKRV